MICALNERVKNVKLDYLEELQCLQEGLCSLLHLV